MFELCAEVIYNRRIKKGYFEIALAAPAIAKTASPGQFVNIKVSDGLEPLLRRPISIHRIRVSKCQGVKVSEIVLLYEVLGKGTEILSQRRPGEFLDVIGPLGRGFRLDRKPRAARRKPILVAGGMGTAPLVFLAEKLREGKRQKAKGKTLVLIGAKTKEDILCEKEFKELGCEVMVSTDDGSRGFQGHVSDLLKDILRTTSHEPRTANREPVRSEVEPPRRGRTAIYACGPSLLLKEISRISLERNIPAQLSLESHMACGIGACMGCVIKVARAPEHQSTREFEYKRVCKEGPVFEAQEIIWGV